MLLVLPLLPMRLSTACLPPEAVLPEYSIPVMQHPILPLRVTAVDPVVTMGGVCILSCLKGHLVINPNDYPLTARVCNHYPSVLEVLPRDECSACIMTMIVRSEKPHPPSTSREPGIGVVCRLSRSRKGRVFTVKTSVVRQATFESPAFPCSLAGPVV